MIEDLDKKLVTNFPKLYKDRYEDAYKTCMCWGFPGTGWYTLIHDMSAKLEKEIEKWIKDNPEDAENYPRAAQVKEKFASLRVYLTHGTEEMHKIINEAEEKSCEICETCG